MPFDPVLQLSDLNSSNSFKILGEENSSILGGAGAGDVNGDGLADIIIGAPFANGSQPGPPSGAAYVVFGQAGGSRADLNLSDLNGTNGFEISGERYSQSGRSATGAGDVNGDGFDDVILGSPGITGSRNIGFSYVVFGRADGFGAEINTAELDGANGFQITGETGGGATGASTRALGT